MADPGETESVGTWAGLIPWSSVLCVNQLERCHSSHRWDEQVAAEPPFVYWLGTTSSGPTAVVELDAAALPTATCRPIAATPASVSPQLARRSGRGALCSPVADTFDR